ncbi:hypothetical protein DFJ74DRAFT_721169, partial [Hyaloraphidium curvatum]
SAHRAADTSFRSRTSKVGRPSKTLFVRFSSLCLARGFRTALGQCSATALPRTPPPYPPRPTPPLPSLPAKRPSMIRARAAGSGGGAGPHRGGEAGARDAGHARRSATAARGGAMRGRRSPPRPLPSPFWATLRPPPSRTSWRISARPTTSC